MRIFMKKIICMIMTILQMNITKDELCFRICYDYLKNDYLKNDYLKTKT